LPALSVRRRELRQSLRCVTVAWMFGVAWMSCTSGDQVRAFARMLGFNDFAFGLLGALPFLATLGQLQASLIIERTGLRKGTFILWGTIHRLLWLMVAAVPLVLHPGPGAVLAVLGILSVSHFLGAMATPGWLTWMSDLVPRRIRGRYFARRVQWAQRVQIVVVILLSLALDTATVRHAPETLASQGRLMVTICAILAIGAVLGAVDILMFRKVRELVPPEPLHPPTGSVFSTMRELLVEPLRDKVFRSYVSYGATITFTATFSGWYFWRYASEGLGFSKLGTNCLFMVIGPLAGNLAINGWGKLQDRWGRRPVLVLATIGTCLSLMPWFFASRHLPAPHLLVDAINWVWAHVGGAGPIIAPAAPVSAYLLGALACVLGGIAWGGVGLAQTGVMLHFADGHGRSKYVAASAVLISVGGALGGLLGGVLVQSLEFLRTNPIAWGPFEWNHWHASFLVSLIVRLASLAWLVHMPDPGAQPVRHMLRYLTENVSNAVSARMFYPLRVFGWGRSDADTGQKGKED
jgi:MFS family permease